MRTNETAAVTTAVSSKPGTGKRRAGWLRKPVRPGQVALAAVAAVGLTVLTAGAATASSIPNGPTVQLSQYPMPTSAPQTAGASLLPLNDGAVGGPASIGVTGAFGAVGPDYITVPGTGWGTQLTTTPPPPDDDTTDETTDQTWYFQRMGYVGVNTPATTGTPDMLAVPVYRVINYNSEYGLYTCLQAGLYEDPAAGSIVDSNDCDINGTPQTNQLWVVGSPGETNDTINATTGAFDGNTSPQLFSQYLLYSPTNSGLSDSVIENVATLAANGWNTSQTPVLSADGNSIGDESPLTLQSQQEGTSVTSLNSTWYLVAGSTDAG